MNLTQNLYRTRIHAAQAITFARRQKLLLHVKITAGMFNARTMSFSTTRKHTTKTYLTKECFTNQIRKIFNSKTHFFSLIKKKVYAKTKGCLSTSCCLSQENICKALIKYVIIEQSNLF